MTHSIRERSNLLQKEPLPFFEDPREIRLISTQQHPPSHLAPRKQLPLNLVLVIISHLDDPGDLARLTRASRLFYYLTIPRLYENVTLRAYSSLRYVNDRPEGFGGGSPFATALDSLISSPNNVAQYVRSLRFRGDWKETDSEDFSKGRVPDNTMMLNVAIKAAITRSDRLSSFSWELNTKPMGTIYQGLSTRTQLASLKIHFPSSRVPRPTVVIPPMPTLKSLHLQNLDPLCYNDDLSVLLLESKGLEDLKMHFSPRMRREAEPSTNLGSYFGRLAASPRKIHLKHIAMANLFTRNDKILDDAIHFDAAESLTFLNCMNNDDPGTVFTDSTWLVKGGADHHHPAMPNMRSLRVDRYDRHLVKLVGQIDRLEECYLVNNRSWDFAPPSSSSSGMNGSPTPYVIGTPHLNGEAAALTRVRESNANTPIGDVDMSNSNSGSTPISPNSAGANSPASFGKPGCLTHASDYIAALTSQHGPHLRVMLLCDRWSLNADVVRHIVDSCPNLEQLAIAMDASARPNLRYIAERLPRLWALRVLMPPDDAMWRIMSQEPAAHEGIVSYEFAGDEWDGLKYFGVGGYVSRLGSSPLDSQGRRRRHVYALTRDEVKHVSIFGLDSNEL